MPVNVSSQWIGICNPNWCSDAKNDKIIIRHMAV